MQVKRLHNDQNNLISQEVNKSHNRLMLIVNMQILSPHEKVIFEMFLVYKCLRRKQTHFALYCRLPALWLYYHQWVGLLLTEGMRHCLRIACYVAKSEGISTAVQKHEVSSFVNNYRASVYYSLVTPYVVPSID